MSNEAYIIQAAMKYGVRIDFVTGVIQCGGWPAHFVLETFEIGSIPSLSKALDEVIHQIEDKKANEDLR